MAGVADHYETLQVHPSAEPEVIQAAYRRLSLKYHPDVYKGADAHERMKRLNAAYAILSDAAKRASYDAQRAGGGRAGASPQAAPGAGALPQVTPSRCDLGIIEYGHTKTATLHLRNAGTGRLSGLIVSHVPWLRVSPAEFNSNDLDITLLFKPDRSGEFRSNRAVEIVSNAGRIAVAVSGSVSAGTAAASGSAGAPSGNRMSTPPHRSGSIGQRQPLDLDRPKRGPLQIPFSGWIVGGTVISSVVWMQIHPVLVVPIVALGAWLLFNHLVVGPAARSGAGASAAPRPRRLARCRVCRAAVDSAIGVKCSRCGGTICPSCGGCPCGGRRR